jgi:hypothetical protein
MEIRYYHDPETGLPHIYTRGVTEAEAEWILARPGEDEACSGGSRQALGQTADGRYCGWFYVPDEEGDGVFVVTGYPLVGKQLKAFRRRAKETRMMNPQRFPKGWDEQRVRQLIAELDSRTDEEWIAADEAAAADGGGQAVITVPATLLPEIRRLLAAHKTG